MALQLGLKAGQKVFMFNGAKLITVWLLELTSFLFLAFRFWMLDVVLGGH